MNGTLKSDDNCYSMRFFLSIFSFGILLFFTSCSVPPPPIERIEPKQPDPVIQRGCLKRGRTDCEGYEDCEDICDDIFRNRRDKQECYEYSSEMVFHFENLIEATEDGEVDEIEDIGADILECMLDIDEREFAEAVSKMNRAEAQDFALLIVENEDFAEVLEEEDDEFNVLKQLINRLSGRYGLEEALSQQIDGDKTLLWLFAEDNESVWNWLDDYVSEECDGIDTEDCPGGENIGAYCNALLESDFGKSDWENFLSDADLFAEEYESEVEDENYEYEIADEHKSGYDGDFRDYCRLKAPPNQPQPPQPQPPQPQPPQPQPPQPQPPQPQPPQPQPPQPQPPQPQPPQPPSTGPDEAEVCGRTDAVKMAIETRLSKDCDDVTHSDLQSFGSDYEERLIISGDSVTSLQDGDFAGLTNLGVLVITNTQLTTLPVNVFNGLSRLLSIRLTHNPLLNSVPEDIFQPVRRSLISIYLSNNQLTSLPQDLFNGMVSLDSLHLNNNQFGSGPDFPVKLFEGPRVLHSINLKNNQLMRLPNGIFSGLRSLGEVYLSGNNFTNAQQTYWEGVLGGKLIGGW